MQLTKLEIIEKMKEVLISINENDRELVEKADENTRLVEDLGLNSVGVIYVEFLLEQTFGIKFENVSTGSFGTVGEVANYIAQKL